MSHKYVLGSVAVKITGIHSHAGLRLSVPINRSSRQQSPVLECAVLLIDPELIGVPIVGDVCIYPPVAVEVSRNHAKSSSEILAESGCRRDILEGPVTLVVKQAIPHGAKRARPAVVSRACLGVASRTIGNRKIDVVHNDQVKPAIPVVVE